VQNKEFQKPKEHYKELLSRVENAFYSDGRYNESEPFFSDIMLMQRKENGNKHLSTLASMESMASAYRMRPTSKAEDAYTSYGCRLGNVMGFVKFLK
jgi:hypothetical protein